MQKIIGIKTGGKRESGIGENLLETPLQFSTMDGRAENPSFTAIVDRQWLPHRVRTVSTKVTRRNRG